MSDRAAHRHVTRALVRATGALVVERLWPALWLPLGVVFLFLGAAFADLFSFMPGWLHALILAVFAAALIGAVHLGWQRVEPVRTADARRRIEEDSGLAHQPLAALSDTLAVGKESAVSQALWAAHQAQTSARVSDLQVSAPDPNMAYRDPFALRAIAILALVVGIAGVWSDDPFDRLARAVSPILADPAKQITGIQLWITPPAYTGAAPITRTWPVEDGADAPQQPLDVPAGSAVLARIVGGDAPVLRIAETETVFHVLGKPVDTSDGPDGVPQAAYRAEGIVVLTAAGETAEAQPSKIIILSNGEPVVTWPLRVLVDRPPVVEYTAPPAATGPRLRLPYVANDDYGIVGLAVVIRHADGAELPDGTTEIRTTLPMGRKRGKTLTGGPVRDYSAHMWAGTQVLVTLEATDGSGQTGVTEDFPMVLPFRVFNHPVAQALVDARRDLVQPSPMIITNVAEAIDELSLRPARFYHDTVVFLGMRVAKSRLKYDGSLAAIRQVQSLLWDLAIRIEDGEYALAEREMLDAQDRLQQAMESDADAQMLEQLMDDLMRSLDKFLEAARDEMERENGIEPPLDPNTQVLDGDMFSDMVERARELMRMGNMDAARQVMNELGRMLQSVQSAVRGGSQMAETMSRARQMMDGLRALSQGQQQLMDQTFEQSRQQRGGESRPGTNGEGDQMGQSPQLSQEQLRRMLGDMMLELDEFLGGFPPQLGDAERAMRRAEQALQDGNMPGAVRNQGDALSNLQQAMDGVAEQMGQRFGAMSQAGQGMGRGMGQRPGSQTDPFGRGQGGFQGANIDDGSVRVPGESEIQRAHEILRELRRRSGERTRPEMERDYIDRLLKRFE